MVKAGNRKNKMTCKLCGRSKSSYKPTEEGGDTMTEYIRILLLLANAIETEQKEESEFDSQSGWIEVAPGVMIR